MPRSAPEKRIDSPGAAIAGPGGTKGENLAAQGAAREPASHLLLQDRNLVLRIQPAAVDDEDAAVTKSPLALDESFQRGVGFLASLAVQVEVALDRELSPPQPQARAPVEVGGGAFHEFVGVGEMKSHLAADQTFELGADLAILGIGIGKAGRWRDEDAFRTARQGEHVVHGLREEHFFAFGPQGRGNWWGPRLGPWLLRQRLWGRLSRGRRPELLQPFERSVSEFVARGHLDDFNPGACPARWRAWRSRTVSRSVSCGSRGANPSSSLALALSK